MDNHGKTPIDLGAVHKGRPQILRGEGVPKYRRLQTWGGEGSQECRRLHFFLNNQYILSIKNSKFLAICASKKKIYHKYKVAWNTLTSFIDFSQKLKQKVLILFFPFIIISNQVDLNWVVKRVLQINFVLSHSWNGYQKVYVYNICIYIPCEYRKSQLGEDHNIIDECPVCQKFQQKGTKIQIWGEGFFTM